MALEIVLSFNNKLAAKGQLQTSRIFQVVVAFFLILESVLATLAGAHHSPPGSLDCALREKWEELYGRRDGKSIERIQDAFSCCGLNSPEDMAWPFAESSSHRAEACIVRYERDSRCLEPWRSEERRVALMLLTVPLAVFLWKVSGAASPSLACQHADESHRLQSCSLPLQAHHGYPRTSDCRVTRVLRAQSQVDDRGPQLLIMMTSQVPGQKVTNGEKIVSNELSRISTKIRSSLHGSSTSGRNHQAYFHSATSVEKNEGEVKHLVGNLDAGY